MKTADSSPRGDVRHQAAAGHPQHAWSGRLIRVLLGVAVIVYAIAIIIVARTWRFPHVGLLATIPLVLAVMSEFAAKGVLGLLFRETLARQGHLISVRASANAALIGTATARLIPGGATMGPSAMAWAVRREDDEAAGAALRAAMISYGGLLCITGLALIWAAGTEPSIALSARAGLASAALTATGSAFLFGPRWLGWLLVRSPGWLRRQFGPTAAAGRLQLGEIGLILVRLAFEVTTLWLVMLAFSIELSPGQAMVAFGAVAVISTVPITPGGIGFVEGGLVGVLTGLGWSADLIVGPVLVYRVISYWLVSGVGIYLAVRLSGRNIA